MGDMNISHKPADHCDPYELSMFDLCHRLLILSEMHRFGNLPGRVFLDKLLLPLVHPSAHSETKQTGQSIEQVGHS